MSPLDQLIIEENANHPPYGSLEDALYDPNSRITVALTSDFGCGRRDMLVLARNVGENVELIAAFL